MSPSIQQNFSPLQLGLIISMGIVAGCIVAIQPLLLGNLHEAGRLGAEQMGHAATAESLGGVTATTLAAMFLKPRHLKPIAAIALLLAGIINGVTGFCSDTTVVALRGLNGLCSGFLFWILLGMMARAANPGRMFAIYVTSQSTVSFTFAFVIREWLLPNYDAAGGYMLFACFDILLIAGALFLPASYHQAEHSQTGKPPLHGTLGLISVSLFLACVLAFWVYVMPLSDYLGHLRESTSQALNAAIGIQILAGLCSIALASRWPPVATCIGANLVLIACIGIFCHGRGELLIFASLAIFAFTWMFIPAFQMPLIIQLDPSLRSALFIGTAQQLGVAFGPSLSAQLIGDGNMLNVATGAMACALGSIIILLIATRLQPNTNNGVIATASD